LNTYVQDRGVKIESDYTLLKGQFKVSIFPQAYYGCKASQKFLVSLVACGDREDFLQFLRFLPCLRQGKKRKNCKKKCAEAEPLHECDFREA